MSPFFEKCSFIHEKELCIWYIVMSSFHKMLRQQYFCTAASLLRCVYSKQCPYPSEIQNSYIFFFQNVFNAFSKEFIYLYLRVVFIEFVFFYTFCRVNVCKSVCMALWVMSNPQSCATHMTKISRQKQRSQRKCLEYIINERPEN